jgi:hypothetical protein
VTLWVPVASVETVIDAAPPLNEAVPNDVVPSRKVTAPVGLPEAELVVAVKTILAPCTAVEGDAPNVVVVVTLVGGGGAEVEPDPPQPHTSPNIGIRKREATTRDRKVMESPPSDNLFCVDKDIPPAKASSN